MRASAAMQDRVLANEKVQVHFNTGVSDAYGDKKGLKCLLLKDTKTGENVNTSLQPSLSLPACSILAACQSAPICPFASVFTF